MKAVYFEKHGGPEVLRYGDRPDPVPDDDEVLIEVRAAAVNPRDWMLRAGTYFARHIVKGPPTIPGSDVSGVVAQVGSDVRGFQVGDEVFAMQHQLGSMGGYAQLIAVKADCVARKPKGVSHIEAAAVPCAGLTAWQTLHQLVPVEPGQRITVIGASGGVGHYAVQLAHLGGAEVTGVCSAANSDFVRGLGASRVVDYRSEDFTAVLKNQDLVFDAMGRWSFSKVRPILTPRGRYVTTVPSLKTIGQQLLGAAAARITPMQRAQAVLVRASGEDLTVLGELLAAGAIRSEIAAVYPLQDAAKAHEQSRTFRTRGKIVLEVEPRA
jgi:NADPH:quinone reductase-like Zn-dependent oxidoreductase